MDPDGATLGSRQTRQLVTSTLERQNLVRSVALAARAASRIVARASQDQRNAALLAIANAVEAQAADILAANERDLAMNQELAPAMRDRLMLNDARVAKLAVAVREIAAQPALVGRVEHTEVRPNGLQVSRVRIPLGVVAMIYEARPNVTTDAAALCLASGNACILRGGREAIETNRALLKAVHAGLAAAELPAEAVQLVPVTDREAIADLVKLEDLIDVCIPRGGEGLIRFVSEHARVPVIKHYKGVCHVYVHTAADQEQALAIVRNAKVSRPGVCNACETVLIDHAIADTFIPKLIAALPEVELRGDEDAVSFGVGKPATEDDWYAEYLDLILAVRVVDDLQDAVAHIERYGSNHTEAIVTTERAVAERFVHDVDSSTVLVNASTRFADGGELGLGAEIGISTTRLHAYGPMGAEGLTTTKFVVRGTGQVRS
ncbi:MAG: glutamate-5-semialdehyde dehydrogenase [Kofleriaceae bacterium]